MEGTSVRVWHDLLVVSVRAVEEPKRWWTEIRGKTTDGETVILKVTDCVPKFWTEHSTFDKELISQHISIRPTEIRSIEGKKLYEVRCERPSHIREVRDHFFPHYCADAKWGSLVRWWYSWTAVIRVPLGNLRKAEDGSYVVSYKDIHSSVTTVDDFDLDLLYYDIETADSLDMENAPEPIVSIAIYDEKTDTHEIGTTVPTATNLVKRFLGSQEALESVVEHTEPIPPLDPAKVVVKVFDDEDEEERERQLMWWFNDRIKHYDPDVIAGQNIIGYDHPYVINRCKRMNVKNHTSSLSRTDTAWPNMRYLKYMPYFDTKIAYAEQVQGAAATTGAASLAWMAGQTLGYGKVPRTRITDLMVRDPVMLAVYNAWDNVCAARCMSKLNLLRFYITKTAYHNSTLHHSHSNMLLVEDMMGHLLMADNMVMPSASLTASKIEGSIEAGGFVMDAPTGVFECAFEVDNSMEYPSAMITGNFSPDTKIDPKDYPDGFPFPVTITPSGRYYRRDVEGIMPRVLRTLAEGREATRGAMKDVEYGSDEYLSLDRRQRVMKENMNSWYGVLGSGMTEKTKRRPFRLADPEIGSDITEVARLHNDWNKNYINNRTLEWNGMEVQFKTLYQDTDSCKVGITNLADLRKVAPVLRSDVESFALQLCDELNDSFDDFVKETLNVDKNEFFRIKPDAYYARYFQWGVKKRYAYVDFDDNFGFRGVEIRRSSTPQVVKDIQKAIFACILEGGDASKLNDLLRTWNENLLDESKTPSSHYGKPSGMKKEGTQAHKASMWSNRYLGTEFDIGDKPCLYLARKSKHPLPENRWVAVEWGENPDDFDIVVDREASLAKYIGESNSFEQILGAMGTSWDRAINRTGTESFDTWFT
tara:strand:- start:16405 stop:19026 length:2622 start_codon:yes stop_codon:yes gene_type:complete